MDERRREQKNICGGCGAPLRKVGEIEGERRGDEFECSRESCGYVEWRMYGDRYYERRKDRTDSGSDSDT